MMMTRWRASSPVWERKKNSASRNNTSNLNPTHSSSSLLRVSINSSSWPSSNRSSNTFSSSTYSINKNWGSNRSSSSNNSNCSSSKSNSRCLRMLNSSWTTSCSSRSSSWCSRDWSMRLSRSSPPCRTFRTCSRISRSLSMRNTESDLRKSHSYQMKRRRPTPAICSNNWWHQSTPSLHMC